MLTVSTLNEDLLYLCAMKTKSILLVLCIVAHCLNTYADEEPHPQKPLSSERGEDSTEIRLSPSFQKELWNAFSFTPQEAPLESTYTIPLDRSLMKEWLSAVPIKAEIAPLNLPGVITKSTGINPYLWQSKKGKFGILVRADGSQCLSGFDVGAIGKFIIPEQIKLRKMQEMADGAREVMDRCFPEEGLAKPIPSDTASVGE